MVDKKEVNSAIIFASTKVKVKSIEKLLRTEGLSVNAIHSDLEQKQREEVLRQFRNHSFKLLVATDIISRGIDIEDIDLIVNFDVPHDPEDYVHRIGRTARANTKGEAITLVNEKDMRNIAEIEKLIEAEIPRIAIPEELGAAPEWKITSAPSNNRNKKKWKVICR